MSASGNGTPTGPRPKIELLTPARSAGEAAAIVAALEQFIAETTPVAEPKTAGSAWQRAALEEGIQARRVSGYAWGHAPRPGGTPNP